MIANNGLAAGIAAAPDGAYQARLWFLDGVSLRMRRPGGRNAVQMLVAYGVKLDGTRVICWPFDAAAEKASMPGKDCCGISTGADCWGIACN